MNNEILLKMEDIHKQFPGVYALKNINFELRAGEVHALLGENGAGKSTLIKVLGGIYHPNQGKIYINSKAVQIQNVTDAYKNGISIIHQELVLVPHMTVAENIFLGREPIKRGLIDKDKMYFYTKTLLDTYEITFDPDCLIADLTIAQQQMVEIVKAMSFNSKILVMDEPTSSIADKEVKFLFNLMKNLTKKGVGIIYISHKMDELKAICDRVTILRDGEYIATKEVATTSNDELIALMVGRQLSSYYVRDFKKAGDVILKCENLNDFNMVKNISFELRKGEIIGFAGLIGSGRSEAVKCLFGLTKNYTGSVYLNDKAVHFTSVNEALKQGLGLVPEDRKLEGLYHLKSVTYNTTIEILQQFFKFFIHNKKKEHELVKKYVDMIHVRTPSFDQEIGKLSGGNQQKVMISRWLATNPKILILDEPTRGVDVGAKAEIYAIMNELIKEGLSIIMISSELPEIINMSDRVYVMAQGVTQGCLGREDINQEKIMKLAAI